MLDVCGSLGFSIDWTWYSAFVIHSTQYTLCTWESLLWFPQKTRKSLHKPNSVLLLAHLTFHSLRIIENCYRTRRCRSLNNLNRTHTHTSSMGTQEQTKSITWHRILFFTSHTQPTRCTAISFDDKQQRIVLVRPYLSPFELLTFKGVFCVKKKLCIGSVDLLAGVAWWD